MDVAAERAEPLFRAADALIDLRQATVEVRRRWLTVRVAVLANEGKWLEVERALEALGELDPKYLPYQAARVCVLLHSRKREEARRTLAENKELRKTAMGRLLTVVVDEEPAADGQTNPTTDYLEAMIRGDKERARAAIGKLPPQRTLFRTDLASAMERPDLKAAAASA